MIHEVECFGQYYGSNASDLRYCVNTTIERINQEAFAAQGRLGSFLFSWKGLGIMILIIVGFWILKTIMFDDSHELYKGKQE
jgi:hypothetical protein